MNQIQQLINQMCPNGVEWKTFGEVFETRNGYTPSTNNQEFWDDGTIPWFKMEDIRENGRILSGSINHITAKAIKGKGLFKANSVILATSATIGEHALITVEHLSNQRFTNFYPQKEYIQKLDMKFVYYYFYIIDSWCKEHIVQGNFAGVNMTELYNCTIPVPPLAIQTRIVEILDHFTNITANLTAELNLRRKQFEYYREKLLAFGEYVEKMKVPSFCELKAGKSINASELNDANEYWCFGGNGTRGKVSFYSHNGDFAIIGRQGALCGCVSWATGKFYATEHAVVVTPKENVNSRFLFHLFTFANLNQYKSQGAQPGLSVTNLNELSFPIPPLATQQSIVSTLDKFTALIANIEQEIALRQKQYEYYREQLLSFERSTS